MPKRILIAEDQADLRTHLIEFLTIEGYEVIGAADGREAYGLVLQFRPDLVLTDLGMPGWDGLALLGAMKEDPQGIDIPVVVFSAWADRVNKDHALRLGAYAYLTKPFTLAEISAVVRSGLEDSTISA